MDSLSNNLVRTLIGGGVRPAVARGQAKPREQENRRSPRAILGVIPDAETIAALVVQARQALSKGIFWDRGAIINILL